MNSKNLVSLVSASLTTDPELGIRFYTAELPKIYYKVSIPNGITDEEADFIHHESIKVELLRSIHEKELDTLREIYPLLAELKYQGADILVTDKIERKLQSTMRLLSGM